MGSSLLDLLLPREIAFFDAMERLAEVFCQACVEFKGMVSDLSTLSSDQLRRRVSMIKELELKGDAEERYIIDKLDTTFITPLDREDIHSIVVEVDKSVDILNDTAQKIEIYGVKKVPENIVKFAEILVDISVEQKRLISSLKDKKDTKILLKKIHRLENEADHLFHISLAELFKCKDPVEIIKLKEIYEHLEEAVDSVDHVGKIVRGVRIKQG
ncbi:MAG: DUF47 family protein [Candidatus Altiarchaeota archaeon]